MLVKIDIEDTEKKTQEAEYEHIYEKAPFSKMWGVLTFEFSGLIFLVLISGSVETSLFHHSILLI